MSDTNKGGSMNQEVSEVKINGVDYIRKDLVGKQEEIKGDIKIVILQRGWVMVGKFEKNGDDCKLHNASVIRVFGTTKGLGEIAKGGPTSTTKLDKCFGVVEFDKLTIIATIACSEDKWAKEL